MELNGINGGSGISKIIPAKGTGLSNGANASSSVSDSGNFFKELVGKVNDLQVQADNKIKSMVTGESKDLHEVMIAVEKANISFQFLTQVRNKAVEAYQDVMRMQV
jgi:flagellar hook-basal body complex protein FliE